MVFWIAILVGFLFTWLGVQKGFYESLVLLFNLVVSIYVAIFLAPIVVRVTPEIEGAEGFNLALCLLLLGVGCFAVLFGASFVLLTGQFQIWFSRVLDVVVAGALGFVAGFLTWRFVALVITATPMSQHWLLRHAAFNQRSEQPNIACLAWCCDRVHSVAGIGVTRHPTETAISRLLQEAREEMPPVQRTPPADANAASGRPTRR
jgi:hypothetical protein